MFPRKYKCKPYLLPFCYGFILFPFFPDFEYPELIYCCVLSKRSEDSGLDPEPSFSVPILFLLLLPPARILFDPYASDILLISFLSAFVALLVVNNILKKNSSYAFFSRHLGPILITGRKIPSLYIRLRKQQFPQSSRRFSSLCNAGKTVTTFYHHSNNSHLINLSENADFLVNYGLIGNGFENAGISLNVIKENRWNSMG